MRKAFAIVLMLIWATISWGQTTEKTRLLIILDCSNSMWQPWQSNSKIKVTQQVLLSFLDSVAVNHDVDVALRVFGHLNKDAFGTKLEVPFGTDNIYSLQSKIKTLVPQGGCTASTAVTEALGDFPASGSARNSRLIITDGMDDRDAEICDVARQVQLSGVVVSTFVLGIGNATQFTHSAECSGAFFPVEREEDFYATLTGIFNLSDKKAPVVLRLLNNRGQTYDTEHAIAFVDARTDVAKMHTMYACKGIEDQPDTLFLDPLITYNLTLFTRPPIRREAVSLSVDSVNHIDIAVNEGLLTVSHKGQRPRWQTSDADVIVRYAGSSDIVGRQQIGQNVSYLAGRYDLDIPTIPPKTIKNVEIRAGASTEIDIPLPGTLQLSKTKNVSSGVIFRIESGRTEYVCDLNPSVVNERITLQPGRYKVLLKPQKATSYGSVVSQQFVIEPQQTTKVSF